MTSSAEEQWPYAKAAITRRQWETHWRELDLVATTFQSRIPPKWKIERRLEHPSLAIRHQSWFDVWYVAITLVPEDIGTVNPRYSVSYFRTREVPLFPTRNLWYHHGPTIICSQLQDREFVERLLDEAFAEIGRQMTRA